MRGGISGGRIEVDRALTLGAVLLAAMYFVVRATANQFVPYSGESAFAGLIAVLLGLCVALKSFVNPQAATLPRALALMAVIWCALFLHGVLRSPNLGAGLPLAADAGIYMLL